MENGTALHVAGHQAVVFECDGEAVGGGPRGPVAGGQAREGGRANCSALEHKGCLVENADAATCCPCLDMRLTLRGASSIFGERRHPGGHPGARGPTVSGGRRPVRGAADVPPREWLLLTRAPAEPAGGKAMGRTLAEKVWDDHVVRRAEGEPDLLYIDLHLLHEVTSPQAFDGLRLAGRTVRRPDLTIATEDHNVPRPGHRQAHRRPGLPVQLSAAPERRGVRRAAPLAGRHRAGRGPGGRTPAGWPPGTTASAAT